jgi:hypothetical protein
MTLQNCCEIYQRWAMQNTAHADKQQNLVLLANDVIVAIERGYLMTKNQFDFFCYRAWKLIIYNIGIYRT